MRFPGSFLLHARISKHQTVDGVDQGKQGVESNHVGLADAVHSVLHSRPTGEPVLSSFPRIHLLYPSRILTSMLPKIRFLRMKSGDLNPEIAPHVANRKSRWTARMRPRSPRPSSLTAQGRSRRLAVGRFNPIPSLFQAIARS